MFFEVSCSTSAQLSFVSVCIDRYAGLPRDTLGCLLTKSSFWCHEVQRELIPKESLQVMGLPVFANVVKTCGWGGPLARAFAEGQMGHRHLRRLAGNGMHMPSIGAALLWALCNLKPDPAH
jgi:hypothetical protein